MQTFECPILGLRPRSEFTCVGGMINTLFEPDAMRAREGLYFGDATARVKDEWWYHRPSHLWFVITRDTATDAVQAIKLAARGVA